MVDVKQREDSPTVITASRSYEVRPHSVPLCLGAYAKSCPEDFVYLIDVQSCDETVEIHEGHSNLRYLPPLLAGDGREGRS